MTIGPWKPINLEAYHARITDIDVRVNIDDSLDAKVDVNFTLSVDDPVVASVSIKRPEGSHAIGRPDTPVQGQTLINFGFSKGAYDLWWPVGYGDQPLYTAEIVIADGVRYPFSLFVIVCIHCIATSSKAICSTRRNRSLASAVPLSCKTSSLIKRGVHSSSR